MRERAFDRFYFYFLGYLRGDTPILKASFAVGVRVRPEGEKGGLFDDNLPPILTSRPVLLSNLTKITRAIIRQRSSPLPSLGWARRWSETKERGEELQRRISPSEQRGRATRRAAVNGNGRSVLHEEGWPPWLALVGRLHFVYISRKALSFLSPRRPT